MTADDAERMLDLYFGLLSQAGLTAAMLAGAAQRFVMRPNAGKAKFFPDPGQLADLCADEVRDRRVALAALDRAQAVMEGRDAPRGLVASVGQLVSREKIGAAVESLEAHRVPPPPKMRNTARAETPESLHELRAAAMKRAGIA